MSRDATGLISLCPFWTKDRTSYLDTQRGHPAIVAFVSVQWSGRDVEPSVYNGKFVEVWFCKQTFATLINDSSEYWFFGFVLLCFVFIV